MSPAGAPAGSPAELMARTSMMAQRNQEIINRVQCSCDLLMRNPVYLRSNRGPRFVSASAAMNRLQLTASEQHPQASQVRSVCSCTSDEKCFVMCMALPVKDAAVDEAVGSKQRAMTTPAARSELLCTLPSRCIVQQPSRHRPR